MVEFDSQGDRKGIIGARVRAVGNEDRDYLCVTFWGSAGKEVRSCEGKVLPISLPKTLPTAPE